MALRNALLLDDHSRALERASPEDMHKILVEVLYPLALVTLSTTDQNGASSGAGGSGGMGGENGVVNAMVPLGTGSGGAVVSHTYDEDDEEGGGEEGGGGATGVHARGILSRTEERGEDDASTEDSTDDDESITETGSSEDETDSEESADEESEESEESEEKLKGYENTGAPWRMQTHFPASTRTIRISKGG